MRSPASGGADPTRPRFLRIRVETPPVAGLVVPPAHGAAGTTVTPHGGSGTRGPRAEWCLELQHTRARRRTPPNTAGGTCAVRRLLRPYRLTIDRTVAELHAPTTCARMLAAPGWGYSPARKEKELITVAWRSCPLETPREWTPTAQGSLWTCDCCSGRSLFARRREGGCCQARRPARRPG